MVDSNLTGMTRALCVLLATVAVAVGNPLCCVLTDCCHTAAAKPQAEREVPVCPHCKKKESTPEPAQKPAPCSCANEKPTLTTLHGAKLHKPTLELVALLPEEAPALHSTSARIAMKIFATPQAAPAHVSLPLLL